MTDLDLHMNWDDNRTVAAKDKDTDIFTILKDVAPDEIKEQLSRLERLSYVGILAAGLSHDFNNLIGAIMGYSSLLKHKLGDDPEYSKPLKIIEDACGRAADLNRQIGNFAVKKGFDPNPVQITLTIDSVLEFLDYTALKRGIEISKHYDPDLSMAMIDESQMHQVFFNIFKNAIEAMPDGGKLRVGADNFCGRMPKLDLGEYVLIEVKDTGAGMDEKTQKRLFNPFYSTKEQGTGLGLAVSRWTIKKHGGNIYFNSKAGEGTTFRILVPAAKGYEPRDG